MVRLLCGLLLLLLMLFALTGRTTAQTQGKEAFERVCSRCHGPDARGGKGPPLIPFLWEYSQVLDTVRYGRCEMPSFKTEQVSDEEVQQIVDYLKTLAE